MQANSSCYKSHAQKDRRPQQIVDIVNVSSDAVALSRLVDRNCGKRHLFTAGRLEQVLVDGIGSS